MDKHASKIGTMEFDDVDVKWRATEEMKGGRDFCKAAVQAEYFLKPT